MRVATNTTQFIITNFIYSFLTSIIFFKKTTLVRRYLNDSPADHTTRIFNTIQFTMVAQADALGAAVPQKAGNRHDKIRQEWGVVHGVADGLLNF